VCERFLDAGAEIVATRSAAGKASGLDERATTRIVDLADGEAVRRLMRDVEPDAVVNLAAVGVNPFAECTASEVVAVNTILPVILFDELPPGAVLLHAGSSSEYARSGVLKEEPIERDFSTPYASSKSTADLVLEARTRSDGTRRCIRARVFGVIGPGEPGHRLLPAIVGGFRRGGEIPMSDGRQIRDFLHVTDVADALHHLTQKAQEAPSVVNVGSGKGTSVRRVAELAAAELGCTDRLRFGALDRRPGEKDEHVADVTRLGALGWTPKLTIEAVVRGTVRALVDAQERNA